MCHLFCFKYDTFKKEYYNVYIEKKYTLYLQKLVIMDIIVISMFIIIKKILKMPLRILLGEKKFTI